MDMLAIYESENLGNGQYGSVIGIGETLLLSLVCVVVVIAILALIIGICNLFFKGIDTVDGKKHIRARKENKILDEDEDAVVALIAATIDFHKETGKDCSVKHIERID